jgi:hypothetical protein
MTVAAFYNGTASNHYFTHPTHEFRVPPARIRSESDAARRLVFLWLSTRNAHTRLHFDQDFNLFTQLNGSKRFTLYDAAQRRSFSRLHPLWHKAQQQTTTLKNQKGYAIILNPGDVLFIPPYVWHEVDTLSAHSASLSSWSKFHETEDAMNIVYKHNHKFDQLANARARLYALRMFLELLVERVHGVDMAPRFFQRLLRERWHHFDDDAAAADLVLCAAHEPIPTAEHLYGDTRLDVQMLAPVFLSLHTPEIRDTLLDDYVEQLAYALLLSAPRVHSFFRTCFSQPYAVVPDANLWQPLVD